jgi:hypothetical protein
VQGRTRQPQGRGGDEHQRWLDAEEARADLVERLEEAFDLEVLEAAEAEVRGAVGSRDWGIYKGLTPPENRLQVKSRVLKRLLLAVRRLQDAGPGPAAQGEP